MDKSRIFTKIVAGVLVGLMMFSMFGTFLYYLFNNYIFA